MNIDPSLTETTPRLPGEGLWRLDAAASTVGFRVPHFWGLITVSGRFERFHGLMETDSQGARRMTLTIDAASLHTGNPQRDRHLRAVAFFDTDHHPEVSFHSTRVSNLSESRLGVEGELQAAGRRLALTLEPSIRLTGDSLEIDVTTTVDQRLLGMTWSPLGMTRSPATLTVHASLRRSS